ncbi:ABC transporter substrate-binding protein [Nesterenkonia flava]|uniref:ABC transporter substrate-binding protein n=1 Tax=Nesterenkonia flava TaxID=469799 RepID=A0ABU1FS08_9MICC|nr:ABC transporter substrate-binding protein [Nesterenkonia flava]MDR5711441.1 ABC transporter substrate-binding protein [Nesterenkonia flava]
MATVNRRGFLSAAGLTGASAALTPYLPFSATDETPSSSPSPDADPADKGTIVIAATSRVRSLDPALAVDTESERICRQIYESLIGIDRETGAAAPALATEWEVSDDGLTYTFQLQPDVTFHDGTQLSADVVVANIERWGRLNEIYGTEAENGTSLAFPSVFGGFLDSEECVLESVEAEDETTVVLTLTEPVSYLLQALTLPAFGIASAERISDDDPDLLEREPAGSGPYRLTAREDGNVTLEAFEEYWGGAPAVPRIQVNSVPKSFDRLRDLTRGAADVYEYITADNLRPLVQAGRQILQRDPFSILYLGFNLEHPVMSDLTVREAAARAVERNELMAGLFLDGTRPAHQFVPAALGVHSEEVPRYSRNLAEAQRLLEESDYDGEPLVFYYPMRTTRSYLPQPEAVFARIARDLTAAGFVIQPRPVVWDEGYLERMLGDDQRAMHLLGRNGGYRSPHSFLGPLFSQSTAEFRYDSEELRQLLAEARAELDDEARDELYRQAADILAADMPAVPLVYPISGLALGSKVVDYPMSPVLHERFDDIVPS